MSPEPKSESEQPASKPSRAPLDEDGREAPRFLLEFPEHPELEPLIVAFRRGNFDLVRRKAPGLAESTDDPAVRAAALELYRRIQPDPLVKALLALALGLFVFIVMWAYFGQR